MVINIKLCKKCNTQVANNAKTCKNCGADAIKNKTNKTKNKKKNTPKTNAPKIKDETIKMEVMNSILYDKKKINIDFKSIKKKIKKTLKKIIIKSKKTLIISFKRIKEIMKRLCIFIYKGIRYIVEELLIGIKSIGLILLYNLKNILKGFFILIKTVIVAIIYIIKNIVILFKKIYFTLSKLFEKLKNKIKNITLSYKVKTSATKIEKIKRKENKKESVKIKAEFINNKEKEKEKKYNKKRIIKIAIIPTIILFILIVGIRYTKTIYEDLSGTPLNMTTSKQATTKKIFDMSDVISYKGIDYKIMKVESSNGNTYKKPKEGNQFLIVTIYIKNNTKNKASYSYENWAMSNSKENKCQRIFTSINVDTALYSGKLVVGAIKTGSMVFEQPIDDKDLKISFYELKKDPEGNEVLDEKKRIFSVKINNPSMKVLSKEEKQNDTKVVQKS